MRENNWVDRKAISTPVATNLNDADNVPGVAPISDDGSVETFLFSRASESERYLGNNNYDDDASKNAHEGANLVTPDFNGNKGVHPAPNIIPAPEGAPCWNCGTAKEYPLAVWCCAGADGKLERVSLSVSICQEYKKLNRNMFALTFGKQEIPPMRNNTHDSKRFLKNDSAWITSNTVVASADLVIWL